MILTPCRPEKLSYKNESDRELLDKISIITCNKKECETIFETNNIEDCVKKYPNKLIVTLGSDGLMYYNGKRIIHMPAINIDVVDTTGAGDAFCAGVSIGLTYGKTMSEAIEIGSYLAASVITSSENVCPRFLPEELGLEISSKL